MRILHLNEHSTCRGGVETYLAGLLPHLESQGHAQALCFAEGEGEFAARRYCVPQLSKSAGRDASEGQALVGRAIEDFKPDVIHVHNVQNVGTLEACLARRPTVLTAHDYRLVCPASSFYFRRTEEICERTCGLGCFVKSVTKGCLTLRPTLAVRYYRRVRWAMKHARKFAGLIAPSRSALDRFAAAGFDPGTSAIVPYFCPIPPGAQPRPVPETPTILFLGRLAANKGSKYFIRALGRLPDSVRGVLVGNLSDENAARVSSLARASGCAERLETRTWAGRDEIAQLFSQTTVFVFPSVWPETLGIVGLEAMASGVPVVASDVGGVREWLRDGVTGLLAPPRDDRALADKIKQILDSPPKNREMGEAGQAAIRDRFSVERHVSDLLQVYHRVSM